MTDAPSPQRAASAEERERLQLEAEERARGWLEAYNLPLNDGAHPMLPTLTRELVSFGRHAQAPLLDRITAAEARAEEAEREQKAAEDSNDALHEKLRALAPHGSCGCSYDRPDDVCLHHSPALAAATADRDRLADEVALLRSALKPFAAACDDDPRWSDAHSTGVVITFGSFRAAARALAATGGTTDDQA